ncbi:MAG: type IX secretion system protein PorQ [Paraprevotella sp.]|nr:type IX secretion system protein PorQ [Paraprevotella sp.]
MKRGFGFLLLLLSGGVSGHAQESSSVFNFLKLPTSSHAAALGGHNISIIEDDAALTFHNPALLSSVSDKTLNFNFMNYMQGSNAGSASFIKTARERSTWGIGAQFAHYGSMKETTAANEILGTFSAIDMAVNGLYSYNFNDRWAGGVTAKMVYSKYGEYSSFAMAVDLGLNYYNEEQDFSVSVVSSNLGGQIKALGEIREHLPFDLQAGFSIGMAHAPVRVSLTMTDITRWRSDYYYNPEKESSFGKILLNHFVVGVDLLPTDYLYISAGFNIRRANEMKAAGSSHGAGLTVGTGVQLSRFKLGLAYGKYHVSAHSILFNLSYSL